MKKPVATALNPATGSFAPYACDPAHTRGRLYEEPEDSARSVYQRDRDRIIHCVAFRRLEYKTQVFVNHEGDHYRTRLTHSLEVAQLARSLSRTLGLNEDLAEALALAHDLGHTPFGHAGEDALKEAMRDFGGFDHNAQTLRILTKLEHRYAEFDGLNLTWETLEGITKHNGPLAGKEEGDQGGGEAGKAKRPIPRFPFHPLPRAIAEYNAIHDLMLSSYAGAEAQVASLADDIAYNNHDVDDGIRSGLFTLEEIALVPPVGKAFAEVKKRYPNIEEQRLVHETIRRMIHAMVRDAVAETTARIAASGVASAQDVRALKGPLVAFSKEMEAEVAALKSFLMTHMYRHWRVNRMTSKARRVVKELFAFFLNEPGCLPPEWQKLAVEAGTKRTAEVVADFIAGMTDRFAFDEYARIFNVKERG